MFLIHIIRLNIGLGAGGGPAPPILSWAFWSRRNSLVARRSDTFFSSSCTRPFSWQFSSCNKDIKTNIITSWTSTQSFKELNHIRREESLKSSQCEPARDHYVLSGDDCYIQNKTFWRIKQDVRPRRVVRSCLSHTNHRCKYIILYVYCKNLNHEESLRWWADLESKPRLQNSSLPIVVDRPAALEEIILLEERVCKVLWRRPLVVLVVSHF